MRKLKIYIDASVASQIDGSERGIITKKFFEMVNRESDKEIIISPVLYFELDETKEEKRDKIYKHLKSLKTTIIDYNIEAEILSWMYVKKGVLTETHIQDLRHVAYAVCSRCNYVVSWNMKHLSNVRTIERVNNYNRDYNFPSVMITTPTLFTGEQND